MWSSNAFKFRCQWFGKCFMRFSSRRVKDRHNLLQHLPLLKKTCVRQAVKWCPLIVCACFMTSCGELPRFAENTCFPCKTTNKYFGDLWRRRVRATAAQTNIKHVLTRNPARTCIQSALLLLLLLLLLLMITQIIIIIYYHYTNKSRGARILTRRGWGPDRSTSGSRPDLGGGTVYGCLYVCIYVDKHINKELNK